MATQNKMIKASNRYLNSYDAIYNAVSKKPLFNQEDWTYAANNGTLDVYSNALLNSDNINLNDYREKYNLEFADSQTRTAALYNEVGANRENTDTKRKKTITDQDGNTVEEEYLASDYQYNLELIRRQNDYYQEVRNQEVIADMKSSVSVGEHILSTGLGIFTGLSQGFLEGLNGLIGLSTAVMDAMTQSDYVTTDTIAESFAKVQEGPVPNMIQDIVNFESNYTTLRNDDGSYTTLGKYVGGISTSLGQMIPSMVIGYGAGGVATGAGLAGAGKIGSVASQASFYGGMASNNIQDSYTQYIQNGADIDSAAILANAGIKSTLQWAIESALGKLLGSTSLDSMVFGRAQSGITSKTLTAAGLENIFKDFLQEGLEEVFQDTSDFLVDEAFEMFIKEYKNISEISWQSLLDAFIIGGFMSFAGSATKILSTRNIYAGDTKLNKIASWQYGLNMETLSNTMSTIEKIINRNDLTLSEKDQRIVRAATLECYAAYRTVTSIYNEIGEKRFKEANDVLDKITEKIRAGAFDKKTVEEYVTGIKGQLKGLSEANIKKIAKEMQEAGVTEVKKVVKPNDEITNNADKIITEKSVQLANDLGVKEVKITDGDIFKLLDEFCLVSENRLKTDDVNELLKIVSIAKLKEKLSLKIKNTDLYNFLTDSYKEFSGQDTFTDEVLLTALLFDKSFFNACLITADKRIYKILSYLPTLIDDIKDKRIKSNQIYIKIITDIKESYLNGLIAYSMIHVNSDYSLFLDFIENSERRKRAQTLIEKGRYIVKSFNRVIFEGYDKLSQNESRLLENLIKRHYGEVSALRRIKALKSKNINTRKNALAGLYDKINLVYYGEYNDVIYKKEDSVQNYVFNNFLKGLNLNLSNFLNIDKLSEIERQYVIENFKGLDVKQILAFRNEQFNKFTNGKLSVIKVNTRYDIVSNYTYHIDDEFETLRINTSDIYNFIYGGDHKIFTNYRSHDNSTVKFIKNELTNKHGAFFTVNDIIKNPDIVNDDTKGKIYEFAKDVYNVELNGLDSEIVFLYLRDYYSREMNTYLVELQDGDYVLSDMTDMLECYTGQPITKDSTIESLIKEQYIPTGLRLEFYESNDVINDSAYFEDYDESGILKNTIMMPTHFLNKDKDFLVFALLHELQHAIQFEKNVTQGLGIGWTKYLSKVDQNRLISLFKKHYNNSLIDSSFTNEDILKVADVIVYYGSGELLAYGIYGDPAMKFIPFRVSRENGIATIHFPSGEKFKMKIQQTANEPAYFTVSKNSNIKPSLYIGSNPDFENVKNDKIRKPNKNELREDDPRAKNFEKRESRPNKEYAARYYVLNDDGTQKLRKNGSPAYHYVYDKEKDRTRGRYVGKRKYAGTNLEYFNKKYTPLQMTKEMQNFILSAKDLDPILQHRIDGSKKGTLTEADVMDYLRSAESIDDNTFKAINNAFFKNEYIKTFKDLENYTLQLPVAWSYARLIKEVPSMGKYESILNMTGYDLNMLVEAVENNKDTDLSKKFSNNQTRYDTFNNRSIISSDEYVRTSLMKRYDGTIQSLWEVAAKTRYPAIHNYETTHKIDLPKDFVEEAYKDMLEVTDITKPTIIEYLKKKLMTELYQKAKENDELDDAEIAHIFYLANELEEKLSSMSMSEIKNEYGDDQGVSKIIAEGIIAETTGKAVTIDEKLPEVTSRELVSRIRGFINTMKANLTGNEIKKFVKEHSDIFEGNLKLRREVYQNLVPDKTQKGSHYRNKSVEEVQKLYDKIVELKNEILDNKKMSKESKMIAEAYDRDQSRRIRELERELEKLKASKDGKKLPKVTEFIVENEVIKVNTNIPMPDVLKTVLRTQYDKTAKTDVKNLTSENERHVKMVSQSFYEQNAERLNTLTQGDIDNLVDFYLRANVSLNDVNAPYIATEVWMLTYLIRAGRKGSANFVIDSETLNKLESTLKNLQSTFGTGQVTWREALKKLNPEVIIAQQMSLRSGVKVSKEDTELLLRAVASRDMKKVEETKNDIYEKMLTEARKDDRKTLDKVLDKILQYERLAMLSGPGTWVRNWTSNFIIAGSNKLTDGMNGKLEKVLMKLFPKNQKIEGQYKIAGTKVLSEVADYISTNLLNNGLLDMVMEALMKYDVRKPRSGERSVDILTDLISNSVVSQFNSKHLSDNEVIRKIENFIRTMISDNRAVKKAAISYLGKMITEDLQNGRIKSKTEVLSQNQISKNFLNYVAEAYKLATYDYMHKSNFLMQLESKLSNKSHGAYFAYKQLFPFAGVSWNWFVEGLNYTPIGLAKSIVNFAKLEKTIEKMDKQRQTYANNDIGVSSDFAKYLTLRNISKGVIGSIGFLIGAFLAGFGIARIDEEDDKYKIIVGDNVYVDISDLFGTQGIFFGMSIVGSIRNKESVVDVFAAGLDQLFIDSTFADMFNNFRYSQNFGDWLMYQPYSMLNMMIPNFVKTITSMTPYEVNYSDGIRGKAEKLLTNAIPGISFAFPHYYDPYTGEKQVSQKLWALTKMVDKLSPLGLSIYNVSDLEKLAIEYGVHKSQLTGRYKVNDTDVKLKSSQVEQLNMFYGQLNVASFKELQSGQVTYKIQQKDGSYKTKRWQQMTDAEKAAIVNRIMTNNSGHAKIYILTNSGKYRYYASDAEYKELRSLGITKNVYRANKKNNGFVKIN